MAMRDLEPKPSSKRFASGARLKGATVSRHGHRILIIEDELLIALMIEEMVRESGYRVSGVAHTIAMAGQEFAKRNYDAVLLDINIGGRFHAETADRLARSGIPFAFVTGYDYLVDPRHEQIPVIQKPFVAAHLRAVLETLVGPGTKMRTDGL
jgi:DNA-binding response OmpR family regulator